MLSTYRPTDGAQALFMWLRMAMVTVWAALQSALPRRVGGGGSASASTA